MKKSSKFYMTKKDNNKMLYREPQILFKDFNLNPAIKPLDPLLIIVLQILINNIYQFNGLIINKNKSISRTNPNW
jgi:hypothetical protein